MRNHPSGPSTSRRRILQSAALHSGAALLAACGQAPAAPPATSAPAPAAAAPTAATSAPAATANPGTQGAVQLTLSVRQAAEGTKSEAGIAAFQKQNPGITVKLETFPCAQYQQKLLSLGAGNTLPDVIYSNVGYYGLFANNGFLAELDPAILSDYDNLVAMAQKLTKDTKGTGKTDQWGWLNAGYDGWSLIGHFIAFGADEVTPWFGATKSQLDQPQQVAAITWLHDSLV